MGIFSRKKDKTEPTALMPELEEDAVNFNSVVDWLVGLSEKDYKKVCDVAVIYREADKKATEALGKENKPTTFIEPPTETVPHDVNHTRSKSGEANPDVEDLLEDELDQAFLETEPEPKPKSIDIKDESNKDKNKK